MSSGGSRGCCHSERKGCSGVAGERIDREMMGASRSCHLCSPNSLGETSWFICGVLQHILPLSKLFSCLTLADTHRWALNHTSQNPDLRPSMNSGTRWTPCSQRPGPPSRRPKKTWLGTTTNAEFQLWNITLGIEYTWMRVISIPCVDEHGC